MWHFERFDHCRSLITHQDNYTETPWFDRLVSTLRLHTKCALKTSGESFDGRLLFAGLWPLVSVLIALHMDDIIICFIACKVIKIFLHELIDTVALLLNDIPQISFAS